MAGLSNEELVSQVLRLSEHECAAMLRLSRYGRRCAPEACPRCGTSRFGLIEARPRVLQCKGCRAQLSVTAGTALEHLKLPLAYAFAAAILVTRQRSVSSRFLARLLGISWRSAWHLGHRVRAALSRDLGAPPAPRELHAGSMPVRRAPGTRPKDKWLARNLRERVPVVAIVGGGACVVELADRDPVTGFLRLIERHLPDTQDVPWYVPSNSRPLVAISRVLMSTHGGVSRRWLGLYLDALAWRTTQADLEQEYVGRVLSAIVRAPPRRWSELRPPRAPEQRARGSSRSGR